MSRNARGRLVGFAVAVLAPGVALLVRLSFDPEVMDERALYITFTPAVAVAAYLGGFRPGLLATALSVLLVQGFLVHPRGSFRVERPGEMVALVFFGLVGVFVSALSESLHRSRARV